ncbi:hypothetical protein PCASD_22040 [Puccinia coronata f. sp. avenae]|uniref:Peroxin/Ferlin domain-containing protein n=1 Tax=Puccinia coronata f. sp. avenae TaxID=200324 RepID=A0A2N5T093_9BASI|nr:hypothetical protein PCASD_22040 [Puccinia coronata f. sp. avenae]
MSIPTERATHFLNTLERDRVEATNSTNTVDMENEQSTAETDQSLIQLVFSLPPPLISLLVVCSRPIHITAQLSLALNWVHPLGPWPSWILLFLWYSVCSLAPLLLSNGLPNLIFLAAFLAASYHQKLNSSSSSSSSPTTPSFKTTQVTLSTHPLAILHSLQDFQIIVDHYSLISARLITPTYQFLTASNPQAANHTIRACLTTLPLSILISRFIPTQTILILIGSTIILWSSPWFKLLRNLLARSPLLQLISLILTDLLLHLRFQPITRWNQLNPSQPQSTKSIISYTRATLSTLLSLKKNLNRVDSHAKSATGFLIDPAQDIEFCLTIFENQRWWMGLDWTPNLLPHERPNWSDSLNHPVPSPTSLQLPAPIVFQHETQKTQRRVEWSWIDPEWKIIDPAQVSMLKDEHLSLIQNSTKRPDAASERPPTTDSPAEKSPHANPTPPHSPELTQRRPRDRSASTGNNFLDSEIVTESLRSSGLSAGVVTAQSPSSATGWEVDANGWQYGDNHWEKMSKKSGIGRYTRRRAWTRKARMVSYILPAPPQSPPFLPSLPEEDHPAPVLLNRRPASPAPPRVGTPPTAAVVPASSSTALSLNLKRSLGLLRRK